MQLQNRVVYNAGIGISVLSLLCEKGRGEIRAWLGRRIGCHEGMYQFWLGRGRIGRRSSCIWSTWSNPTSLTFLIWRCRNSGISSRASCISPAHLKPSGRSLVPFGGQSHDNWFSSPFALFSSLCKFLRLVHKNFMIVEIFPSEVIL